MTEQELNKRVNYIATPLTELDKFGSHPKNMLIEVTNSCNANCIFCANSKSNRKRENIDETFVDRILKEGYDLGLREVGFYTTGEPLLNKKLPLFVKSAKEIGYSYTYITTNGILATIQNLEPIITNGIDSIKFSINSINEKDYLLIHGVDKFDVAMNNLKALFKYRKEHELKFKIFVSYIATKYTEYDNDLIKKCFIDYCDDVAIINVRNQSGMMPEINEYLLCENISNKIKGSRNLPCNYPFKTICITKEGYLTGCCTDFNNYLAVADLNNMSLEDAWQSEKYVDFRERHIKKSIEGTLCENCIYGVKTMPTPLDETLFTKMNEQVFTNDSKVKTRLKRN